MGAGYHGGFGKTTGSKKNNGDSKSSNSDKPFASLPKTINEDKQGKHIVGHKNYIPGRSILTISISEAQELIDKYSGTGTVIGDHKERIDFGRVIGKYVDKDTGKESETTIGIIHYSNTGVHIVPAKPKEK